MERGDNVVLGNMCENLPHEMVPMTKFSAFGSWTNNGRFQLFNFVLKFVRLTSCLDSNCAHEIVSNLHPLEVFSEYKFIFYNIAH